MNNTQKFVLPAASVPHAPRATVVAALLATYLVWGTTYLAIRYALEGFPPLFMMGIRFLIAGCILLVAMRIQGTPMPTRRQWRNSAIVGALLLGGGMGSVAYAEQSVASGLAATMVSSIPLWIALISGLFGQWPTRREWLGVAVGFAGVVLLNLDGGLSGNPLGVAALLFGPLCWSFGSVLSRRMDMPHGLMGSATEMLAGSVVLLGGGLLMNERITQTPSTSSVLALGYLIVFGSLIAYTAYTYLRAHVRPSLATSYAYVNPVVAVLLGVGLANEQLTILGLLSLPVILAGVALLTLARNRT